MSSLPFFELRALPKETGVPGEVFASNLWDKEDASAKAKTLSKKLKQAIGVYKVQLISEATTTKDVEVVF